MAGVDEMWAGAGLDEQPRLTDVVLGLLVVFGMATVAKQLGRILWRIIR